MNTGKTEIRKKKTRPVITASSYGRLANKINGFLSNCKDAKMSIDKAVEATSISFGLLAKSDLRYIQDRADKVYKGRLTRKDKMKRNAWKKYQGVSALILFSFGFYFMGVSYTGYSIVIEQINNFSNSQFFLGLLLFVVGLFVLNKE